MNTNIAASRHAGEYAIQVSNCTKKFGKVVANDNVQFDLKWGEIHALLGENGSGKTTFVNILSGLYQPDDGEVYVNGNKVRIATPRDAYNLGIGMIHQHFMLVDVLTAAENIVLGLDNSFFLNYKAIEQKIGEIADQYGFHINLRQRVADMSVSEKQTVEIVKALYRGAEILILDEPTAVLTPQEADKLFAILRSMREQGKAIILISHKMNELFAVADRVTILRKGQYVDTLPMAEATQDELTNGMVGHTIDMEIRRVESEKTGEVVRVEHLDYTTEDGVRALKDISFSLYGGEILGVAGVAGSGQKELCDAIAGLIRVEKGKITVMGADVTNMDVRSARERGARIAYVPEDRLGMGLVSTLGMVDNLMLRSYDRNKGPMLDRKTPTKTSYEVIEQLSVSTPDVKTPVRKLSGGNVQKVLLGREIHENPPVLITSYPVRGLDIGASKTIYDLLNQQKQQGTGVLFVGEDLDVLIGLCDRLLVLCDGEVRGIVDPQKVTKNEIGLMMMDDQQKKEASIQ